MAVAQDGAHVAGMPARFALPVKGHVMTTSILVTGGTGRLGRPAALWLRDAGASVTVLSRHPRETAEGIRYTAGDLSTGKGIEAAVRGAEVIVHCAGSSKGDEQKTRTLVSAAKDARHIVLMSVVGTDRAEWRDGHPILGVASPRGRSSSPGAQVVLDLAAGNRAGFWPVLPSGDIAASSARCAPAVCACHDPDRHERRCNLPTCAASGRFCRPRHPVTNLWQTPHRPRHPRAGTF